MTPINIRQQILEWTEFNAGYDPGNGKYLPVTGDRDFWELIQNTANTLETRTLVAPNRPGLLVTLEMISVASGGTLAVALNNSAGSVSSTLTFTTLYTMAVLQSYISAFSNGSKTLAWKPIFSNL